MENKIILTTENSYYKILVYDIPNSNNQPRLKVYEKDLKKAKDFAEDMSEKLNLPLEENLSA